MESHGKIINRHVSNDIFLIYINITSVEQLEKSFLSKISLKNHWKGHKFLFYKPCGTLDEIKI